MASARTLSRPAGSGRAGEHTDEALADWGLGAEEIRKLRDGAAIA